MSHSVAEALEKARSSGYAAKTYAECPYISGQRILEDWVDGFVAQCIDTGIAPPDTPPYVLGRIAYLCGTPCSERPDGELATGRWMSGWLVQRGVTPDQPNKCPGDPDSLLELVFGT